METKNEVSYTPGPWWHEQGNKSSYIHREGEGLPICHLAACHDALTERANARLIAAAPELLEALEDMTARYAKLETLYFKLQGSSETPDSNGTIRAARAAISKAKGGAL